MLYMMVGIQGSGKSTYAKKLSEEKQIPLLSSDRTRQEFPGVPDKIIWPYLYSRAAMYVKCNEDFIFDATNITKELRKKFIIEVEKFGVKVEWGIIWVKASRETCIERVIKRNEDPNELFLPLEVIDKYIERFEEPTIDEGYKFLEVINSN